MIKHQLPDGSVIHAYFDHGKLVTRDCPDPGGKPRPVENIAREICSDFLRRRPRDRPLRIPSAKDAEKQSRSQFIDEMPDKACASSTFRSAKDAEKQSRSQFIDEMLDKACASSNLRLSQPCELVGHNITQTLEELDVVALKELLDTTTLEKSTIAPTSSSFLQSEAVIQGTIEVLPPSRHSSPSISARKPSGWPMKFFIRSDLEGSFHTYPHLGGPFQTLQEAENAIGRHLDDMRDEKMCMDGLSLMEINVRRSLYWNDGTRRNSSKSCTAQKSREHLYLLVQALLDKYNEDNNLLEDLAYELKDVVCSQTIYEGEGCPYKTYYHLNLTTKTKGADDLHCGIDNLFFAEITRSKREHEEFVLSCIYMVKPNDNGQCYGCTSNGSVDLKHPNNADEYKGGHLNTYLPCHGSDIQWGRSSENLNARDDEARMEAEEARLRYIFKCLDDPCFLERMACRRYERKKISSAQL